MNTGAAPRKKIFLVNRDFQLRYTKIAVIVGLLTTILTSFLILYPMFQFKIIRGISFVPPAFVLAMVVAAVLNFTIIAGLGILITHKLAGPMFSMVRQMRLIKAGRFDAKLIVRKGDDLRYLVRNFNDLVDELVAMTKKDKKVVEDAMTNLKGNKVEVAAEGLKGLIVEFNQRIEGADEQHD